MRKLRVLLLGMLAFILMFSGVVMASEPYGEIKVTYRDGDVVFPDLEIHAYRVADYDSYSYFTVDSTFASYPINVTDVKSQQEWRDLANTLTGYIYADQIPSDCMIITDEEGVVIMDNMEVGLYLVLGVNAKDGNTVYTFDPFFVYLPQRDESGNLDFSVEVFPKYSLYVPKIDYSVVKLWKDNGTHPKEVEIEIYCDGILWSAQTLNRENQWSFSWQADDDGAKWTVVEKNVPTGYTVSVSEKNGIFSVVNTLDEEDPPEDPPIIDSGDRSSIGLYAMLMCISGFLLLVLGVYYGRKDNEEA